MLDAILVQRNISFKVKVTVKMLVSVLLVVLSVALPQIVHIVSGNSGGMTYLPMYLPVLIAGCLLGFKWGLGIGLLSPLASFAVTSLMGNAMPALTRLPFMVFELGVFSLISGLFSKKISQNSLYAFPAVIAAQVCGRGAFLLAVAIFQGISPLQPTMIWNQVQQGLIGLYIQAALVPLVIIGLSFLIKKDKVNQ